MTDLVNNEFKSTQIYGDFGVNMYPKNSINLPLIYYDTVNNVVYIGKSDNSTSIVIQGNLTYPNSVSNWYPTPNEYGYIDQSNSNAFVNQFNSNFTNNYVNQFSW